MFNNSQLCDVCMPDIVGDYDTPDDLLEWEWVEAVSSYGHKANGCVGVWEFIINLSNPLNDIPEKLRTTIQTAIQNGYHYILFHQGT